MVWYGIFKWKRYGSWNYWYLSVSSLRFGHWLRLLEESRFSFLSSGWRRGLHSYRKVDCSTKRFTWWIMQKRNFIFVFLWLRILLKHILQRILVSLIQQISWFEPTYYTREYVLSGQGRFVDALRSICSGGYLLLPHLLGSDVWVTIKRQRLSLPWDPRVYLFSDLFRWAMTDGFLCYNCWDGSLWFFVWCSLVSIVHSCINQTMGTKG